MFYLNAGGSLQKQKVLLSKDFPAWQRDLSSVPPRASAASQNVPSHCSRLGACPPTETKAHPRLTSWRCAGSTAGLQDPLFTKPFLNWETSVSSMLESLAHPKRAPLWTLPPCLGWVYQGPTAGDHTCAFAVASWQVAPQWGMVSAMWRSFPFDNHRIQTLVPPKNVWLTYCSSTL